MKRFLIPVFALVAFGFQPVVQSQKAFKQEPINWLNYQSEAEEVVDVEENIEEATELEVIPFQGKNFTASESRALEFFQEQGITDKMALAVILGNIKQESMFVTNICEGGARVNYEGCWTGGYGLIQWTTVGRYDGLGRHARNLGQPEESLETQLSYVVTEREWKEAEWRFKTPGKDLSFYMKGAYRWLGWGIYGNRGYYSQQYFDRIYTPSVDIEVSE